MFGLRCCRPVLQTRRTCTSFLAGAESGMCVRIGVSTGMIIGLVPLRDHIRGPGGEVVGFALDAVRLEVVLQDLAGGGPLMKDVDADHLPSHDVLCALAEDRTHSLRGLHDDEAEGCRTEAPDILSICVDSWLPLHPSRVLRTRARDEHRVGTTIVREVLLQCLSTLEAQGVDAPADEDGRRILFLKELQYVLQAPPASHGTSLRWLRPDDPLDGTATGIVLASPVRCAVS